MIEGIGHNVDFLSALMQHPRFRAGALTTGFIAEEYPEGFRGAPADDQLLEDLAIVAALVGMETDVQAGAISGQLNGAVHAARAAGRAHRPGASIGSASTASRAASSLMSTSGEGRELIGHWRPGQPLFKGTIDGREPHRPDRAQGAAMAARPRAAPPISPTVLPEHVALLSRHMIEKVPPDLSRYLICPMPGLLTALHVGEGDRVEAGQPLAVVEAMKMENILRAEKAGVVKKVDAKPGDSLAVDAVILEFE